MAGQVGFGDGDFRPGVPAFTLASLARRDVFPRSCGELCGDGIGASAVSVDGDLAVASYGQDVADMIVGEHGS